MKATKSKRVTLPVWVEMETIFGKRGMLTSNPNSHHVSVVASVGDGTVVLRDFFFEDENGANRQYSEILTKLGL